MHPDMPSLEDHRQIKPIRVYGFARHREEADSQGEDTASERD